jgi:hypothetical protein
MTTAVPKNISIPPINIFRLRLLLPFIIDTNMTTHIGYEISITEANDAPPHFTAATEQ